jgi:hypothetical protein
MTAIVSTRPRIASVSTGRLTGPDDSGSRHDPYGETAVQRAINRRAPTPVGIVVTGDNHLSAALPGLSPQRRAERHERLRRSFSAAVDYALQHGARLFVIAGDLFDTPAPSNSDRAFVAGELARLRRANIICAGVSGSHDSPRVATEHGGESPHHTYAALEGMTYFPPATSITPRLAPLGDLRLAIAGISTNPAAPRGADPFAEVALADPEGVLRHADLGLLIVHAGIEGFARPGEDERIVSHASLEALPPLFRVVVAGHAHHFGRARLGEREIIVPGSTERMDFDSQPGSSGFAWLEVTSDGLTRVRRIAVAEQPRADVELATTRLFPSGIPADEGTSATVYQMEADDPASTPALPVMTPDGLAPNGTPAPDDERDPRALAEQQRAAGAVFATARAALDEVCSDETLVRLRLVGPISRGQYHQLPLREIQRYGAQHAFTFDLDTSGLEFIEPAASSAPSRSGVQRAAAPTGPLSPAFEVERLLQDRLARVSPDDPTAVADLHAAASILLARLRASSDREVEP